MTPASTYTFRRSYAGSVKGVIFDWAGTTVDYGCFAPTVVFIKLFKEQGVPVTMAEARGPMGSYKRDHIRSVMFLPAVAERWQAARGRAPEESDVDTIYKAFIPRQIEVIAEYADLIPGVVETADALRKRGLKIGSTTGYTRAMMEPLLPEAKKRGYAPDTLVCPDDVGGGRPAPWMCFQNARELGIYPMESLIKVGDTLTDIEEGLNAGMWTVGLAKTGNELGIIAQEVNALPADKLNAMLAPIYQKFYQAGAHYVIDSVADLLPVLDRIEARLACGEKP